MPYNLPNCQNCPYLDQIHLPSELRTTRPDPPVELERNNSTTLVLGEAPGIEEWRVGAPFQATRKVGGTAGSRLARSWQRVGKRREDFDFLNTVQCYPGQTGTRDARPHPLAVCACTGKLATVLTKHGYERVICLGEAAKAIVSHLRGVHALSFKLVLCGHPTGGVSNVRLDAVW